MPEDNNLLVAFLEATQIPPVKTGPFFVYSYMYEKYREVIEAMARYYFNGEVVVMPDPKIKEDKR